LASDPSAANRIIKLIPNDTNTLSTGKFEIQLPGTTTKIGSRGKANKENIELQNSSVDLILRENADEFNFEMPSRIFNQAVQIKVFDLAGKLRYESQQSSRTLSINKSVLKNGKYLVDLSWQSQLGLRRESMAISLKN